METIIAIIKIIYSLRRNNVINSIIPGRVVPRQRAAVRTREVGAAGRWVGGERVRVTSSVKTARKSSGVRVAGAIGKKDFRLRHRPTPFGSRPRRRRSSRRHSFAPCKTAPDRVYLRAKYRAPIDLYKLNVFRVRA